MLIPRLQSRASRVPAGAVKVTFKDLPNTEVYLYDRAGTPCALAYAGRRSKPDIWMQFRDEKRREDAIKAWVGVLRDRLAQKQAQKTNELQIEDILYTSWGYDQTNVDFYQVTGLIGTRMVELRQIAQSTQDTHFMAGTTTARPNEFIGETLRRKVSRTSVKIDSVRSAYKWDGKPMHCSWGH